LPTHSLKEEDATTLLTGAGQGGAVAIRVERMQALQLHSTGGAHIAIEREGERETE